MLPGVEGEACMRMNCVHSVAGPRHVRVLYAPGEGSEDRQQEHNQLVEHGDMHHPGQGIRRSALS